MARESSSHLGSGTTPYIFSGPSGQTTPHASEGDVLFNRDGQNIIVLNPEDFSVFRNGITKQVSLTANVVSKLDSSLENRRAVAIANLNSTSTLFIGFHPEVTVNNGWPIFAQTSLSLNCSNKLQIYGVCVANIKVGTLEVS